MTRFLSTRCFLLVGLLFVASIALTPAAWATPTQTAPAAQTDATLEADDAPANAPVNSPADSPAGNLTEIHHPRGDLAGSYSLNTPARPGFWVAAGFTGLVGFALLITLVRFRPGNPL